MRRIILFPLFLSVLFLLSCGSKDRIMVQDVEFKSEDGIQLAGTLYSPPTKNKVPGVILAHMYQNNKKSWDSFARKLAKQGYAALAFDFRGWGESEGGGDIPDMYLDVLAAANYLANFSLVDRERIAVVGASMGGMSAVIAGAKSSLIDAVVTICAPSSWQGSEPIEYVDQISPRPILVIAAADDAHLDLRVAKMLYLKAGEPRQWLALKTNRHGTDIFSTGLAGELETAIINFLCEHLKNERINQDE